MNIERKKVKQTNMQTNETIGFEPTGVHEPKPVPVESGLPSVESQQKIGPGNSPFSPVKSELVGNAGNQAKSAEKSLGNDREFPGNPSPINPPAPLDPVQRLRKWADQTELGGLNNEDEARVLELLEEHTYARVRDIIAQPRPVGLNCRTSISSLQRFYACYRAELMEEEAAVAQDQIEVILEQAGEDDEAFYKAARHLLKRRLLETSISPVGKTDEICRLFGMLERIRMTDIAERRLGLDEEKVGAVN